MQNLYLNGKRVLFKKKDLVRYMMYSVIGFVMFFSCFPKNAQSVYKQCIVFVFSAKNVCLQLKCFQSSRLHCILCFFHVDHEVQIACSIDVSVISTSRS